MHATTQKIQLNVYIKPQGTDGWAFGGNFDNRWLYAQVNIRSPNQPWQGVFEAHILVQNPDASVALDDVSITRGLCP
ncbi:unnamed protein product, partial [Rotaria magnacalcarata]